MALPLWASRDLASGQSIQSPGRVTGSSAPDSEGPQPPMFLWPARVCRMRLRLASWGGGWGDVEGWWEGGEELSWGGAHEG